VGKVSESEQSSVIVIQDGSVRALITSSLLKLQRVKDDWCQKSSQNFALPLKNLGEVWEKCMSELI